jgi:hypothetical protein
MSDPQILALGCGVSFLALAGAYVTMRQRFLAGTKPALERQRVRQERRARHDLAAGPEEPRAEHAAP